LTTAAIAQTAPIGLPHMDLGPGPFTFDTAEQHKIKVSVIAHGMPHPWALAFLPDGRMLITERGGKLRMIRDGALDPTPVAGLPKLNPKGAALLDLALDPNFAQNHFVYFTYIKPNDDASDKNKAVATTLGRATWNGSALTGARDLFICDYVAAPASSRIAFGKDGTIFMTTGGGNANAPQEAGSDYGKVLHLNADGSVPKDNPYVGRAGYKPEIFTMGHRDALGLAVDPQSGAVLENENGPDGGDEINLLLPGKNYGWPLVSYGRQYNGPRVSWSPSREGIEEPLVIWIPSIALSGMSFYSGDKFPAWKGNVFVGGMRRGEIPGTGRLERVVFNKNMEEIRRESLLEDLHQRIRDVRQGPDGFLYVLTEEEDGALLKIEPLKIESAQ